MRGIAGGKLRRVRRTLLASWAVLGVLAGVSCAPRVAPVAGPQSCERSLVGVAHPDDDLYFVNPEIRRTVQAGCPVTTVFLTAGDDGRTPERAALDYVEERERGVRAAYAQIVGVPDRWTEGTVRVNGRSVRSLTLDGAPTPVRLLLFGLHDGRPEGQGRYSMLKLFVGTRRSIPFFGSKDTITGDQLVKTLAALARQDKAQRILTLDYDNASFAFGLGGRVDHSDHGIGARYFRQAGYAAGIPVSSYLGYTMSSLAPNLPRNEVLPKEAAVRRYLSHVTICRSEGCSPTGPSDAPLPADALKWIRREYRQVHRGPRPGEILADIGRTTVYTRDPEQCLEAVLPQPENGAVRINGCDGADGQKWDVRSDRTIRSQRFRNYCLTLVTDGVGLARCARARAEQRWTREPWRSTTWKRSAWRIAGAENKCLYQDDRHLPPRWDSDADRSPRLGLVACDAPSQPGIFWRMHGTAPSPSAG
ncbi:ricin-type beta-trefoil lectin domain protein [Streptomyces sp. NPDC056796]|uniref:ricin-type beta-trefoil lectin domain protein n=1 Tax=Streptomyces sp. NPDC056796 TaxID=3345947 RepID=UPI0036D18454